MLNYLIRVSTVITCFNITLFAMHEENFKIVHKNSLSAHLQKSTSIAISSKQNKIQVAYLETNDVAPEKRQDAWHKRYPGLFQAFLKNTNEKHVTINKLKQLLCVINQHYPDYFKQKLAIYDIGFGNGQFSANFTKLLSEFLKNKYADIMLFSGMDLQENFVKNMSSIMNNIGIKTTIEVGNFECKSLRPESKNSANFILAAHVCYDILNMEEFIAKSMTIAKPNTLMMFIHSAESPIALMLRKHANILGKQLKNNINTIIETTLKKKNLDYVKVTCKAQVTFPEIKTETWNKLNAIPFANYEIDYANNDSEFLETKKLLEFFLNNPLEAFRPDQRQLLLEAFEQILITHQNKVPMPSTIFLTFLKKEQGSKQLSTIFKKQ